MVGWSGAGAFEDLERTVVRKLSAGKGETDRVGDALLVDRGRPGGRGEEPALPPGSRVDRGRDTASAGPRSYLKNLELLGKRYLSKGRTFKISAQVVASKQTCR